MDNTKYKTAKRSRSDSGPDPECVVNWPRFLVVEGCKEDQPLRCLSPFAISKGIEGLIGTAKDIKRLRSGDVLVEVNRSSQAEILLKADKLALVPIKVSPHRSLNSSRGVIRCPDIKSCLDEEILEGLSSQNVTHIHRILITRDGAKQPTGTFILTFNSPTPPATVKVGYLQVKVDTYIPNPIRCFKCQRYGHFKSTCKRSEACEKCGKEDHVVADCKEALHCVNCDGSHPSNSKTCPKWIEEKEIQKIKVTGNMSYAKAKDIFHSQNTRLQSFAAAVKSTPKVVKPQTQTIHTQTDLVWPLGNPHPTQYWVSMLDPKKKDNEKKNQAKATQSAQLNTAAGLHPQVQAVRNRSISKERKQPEYKEGPRPEMSKERKQSAHRESPRPEMRKSRATEKKEKKPKNDQNDATLNLQCNKTKPQSNRQQKGSKDPIQLYNRYGALSSDDEMEILSASSAHSTSSLGKGSSSYKDKLK